jgi:NTP pyrophosphatase (non-canonical NTP hydrolase)
VTYPFTDLPQYQERVASFVDMHALRASAEARALDLVSEVGEVAKEVLKATRYGEQPFAATEAWTEEIADVFFSLICLANATNVDLDRALEGALEKYRQRLTARGDAGSGR